MLSLVLSLHLLGGGVLTTQNLSDAPLQLRPPAMATTSPSRYQRPIPIALPPHLTSAEFARGFSYALVADAVLFGISLPFVVFAVFSAILGGNPIGLVAIALGFIGVDVLVSPAFAVYGVATSHGDTGAGPIVLGYVGGLVAEMFGLVPVAIAFVFGGTILLIPVALTIDALATAGGATALYHLAAGPSPYATIELRPAEPKPTEYPPPRNPDVLPLPMPTLSFAF